MIAFARNGASEDADNTACRCDEMPLGPDRSDAAAEMNELARELAAAFGEKLISYREHAKLTAEEAAKRVAEDAAEDIDRILTAPPDAVSWIDLYSLGETDANLAFKRWEQIKEAARGEVRSGYRAARVVEDPSGPLERARFLAVRGGLTETWLPRNAVEQHLVDQLAQWQVLLWRWQEALSTWTNCATSGPRRAKKGESCETMRVSESEALEGAARMVEQLHRQYLRTLKALQHQRRPCPTIAVRRAEQVNVGPLRISVDSLGRTSHFDEGRPDS